MTPHQIAARHGYVSVDDDAEPPMWMAIGPAAELQALIAELESAGWIVTSSGPCADGTAMAMAMVRRPAL